ncbi:hypothetical protein BU16DRAFT_533377 [Lophium mytilinum]|uniref:Uncharacterized protein n=1 Tax=Lophium mytilinum TaxID=390894 RepID=A0A6A6RHA1_9PEZI|nr:hypothetical protein BU16DRAFT_533377 [Lophium mytilinum]
MPTPIRSFPSLPIDLASTTTMPNLKRARSDETSQSRKRRRLAGRNLEETPALLSILNLEEPEPGVMGVLSDLNANRPVTYLFANFATHDARLVYGFGGYNCPPIQSATETQSHSESKKSALANDENMNLPRYEVYRGLAKRRRDSFEIQQRSSLPPAKRRTTCEDRFRRFFPSQLPQPLISRKRVMRDEAELKAIEESQRRIKRPVTRKNNVKTFSTLMHRVPQEIRDLIFANVVHKPEGLRYDPISKTFVNMNGSKRTTVLENISNAVSQQSNSLHIKANVISFPKIAGCLKVMKEMPRDQKASLRHIKVYCDWTEPYWREFLVTSGRNLVRDEIDELLRHYKTLPTLKSITLVIHAWNWGTRREFKDSFKIAELLTGLREKGRLPNRKKLAITPLIGEDPDEVPYNLWCDDEERFGEDDEKKMVAKAKKWVRNED